MRKRNCFPNPAAETSSDCAARVKVPLVFMMGTQVH